MTMNNVKLSSKLKREHYYLKLALKKLISGNTATLISSCGLSGVPLGADHPAAGRSGTGAW